MAGELLNDSQTIRIDGHPFLLVLAGTPDIKVTLRKSEAGFWERNELCPLGRLTPEEAKQAITIPLEEAAYPLHPASPNKSLSVRTAIPISYKSGEITLPKGWTRQGRG